VDLVVSELLAGGKLDHDRATLDLGIEDDGLARLNLEVC